MDFEWHTDEEIKRWLWLRATEYGSLHAYLFQPVAPVLFIFILWHYVLIGVIGLELIWCSARYSFVNAGLAGVVVLPLGWLNWPAGLGSSIYLFIQHQFVAAVLAFLSANACWNHMPPAKVELIERALAKKAGFVDPKTASVN